MKWYIHVNQHKIRKNIHAEEKEPPIAIRRGTSRRVTYCNGATLPPNSRIVYSPCSPILSCGARLVIECDEEPTVIN